MQEAHDHDHHQHEPVDYATAVQLFRSQKDEYFRKGDGSPIPLADRDTFAGLAYYPVDPALAFDDLTLVSYTGTEPVQFEIPTSDGKLRPAVRAGTFEFAVQGAACRLTAYRFAAGDSESLFVPFLDRTSGTETYGAGRYLDLEAEEDGTYTLDFNLSYHPSCAYDPKFSCPLTPTENRLAVRIEAGQRLP